MARPSAPAMPTQRQIEEAHKAVAAIYPGARIVRVGPEGVTFAHPDANGDADPWRGKPFSAESK